MYTQDFDDYADTYNFWKLVGRILMHVVVNRKHFHGPIIGCFCSFIMMKVRNINESVCGYRVTSLSNILKLWLMVIINNIPTMTL